MAHGGLRFPVQLDAVLVKVGRSRFSLVGCRPSWQVLLLGPDGNPVMVDRQVLASLDDFEEVDGQRRVNLERVLLGGGHQVVERAGYVHPGFCGVKVTGE